jgi:hypothetical protein
MKLNHGIIAGLLLCLPFASFSQVGIGTTSPDPSAILDIASTNSGLLIPRVGLLGPLDVITIPSPATGLLVFNVNEAVLPKGFYYWDGSWARVGIATSSGVAVSDYWELDGNAITSGDFIGTTNNEALVFKVNNENFVKLDTNGAAAIGYESNASGLNSTAIGYQASTAQDNAIVLGNANAKIGMGTSTPDEKLHVVGSVKIVDGTQANNYVLTSDANGKGSWKNVNTVVAAKVYGEKFRSSSQTISSNSLIQFNENGSSNGLTLGATNTGSITILTSGVYRINYSINFQALGSSTNTSKFSLIKNSSPTTVFTSTSSIMSVTNNNYYTVTKTSLINLDANDVISIKYFAPGVDISLLEGTSLTIEKVN